jgi:hypothetical protein
MTGFIWLTQGPVAGSCEHGDEPSVSMTSREWFEQIRPVSPDTTLVKMSDIWKRVNALMTDITSLNKTDEPHCVF